MAFCPAAGARVCLNRLDLLLVPLLIRLRQNLPQSLAAIDNLLAAAPGALIFAHVASRERGPFDLVHLDVAIGTSRVVHNSSVVYPWLWRLQADESALNAISSQVWLFKLFW